MCIAEHFNSLTHARGLVLEYFSLGGGQNIMNVLTWDPQFMLKSTFVTFEGIKTILSAVFVTCLRQITSFKLN